LDGTLLDTTESVERSWHKMATHLGVDFETFRPFMHGIPANQVLDAVVPELKSTDRSRAADAVLADQTGGDGAVRWMPGAQELIHNLQGLPWAVVTSGTRRLALASMAKAGMPQPPLMVTADDVGIGKPNPAPFLRAMNLLRVPPYSCVAIEDSPAGVRSAQQARVRTIAVAATHTANRLTDADFVLDRLPAINRDNGQIVLDSGDS
jgi:sugar-phosphatase